MIPTSPKRKIFVTAFVLIFASLVTACGGGNDGAAPAAPTLVPTPPPASGDVTISGTISFESVGVDTDDFTLDLSDLTSLPARGVIVRAVSANGTTLASTSTNPNGQYALSVDVNTNVRIEAMAQLLQNTPGDAQWNISVLDNTNGNAQYVLSGSLANSGTANSTRDLMAASGSNGVSAYTSTRAAGPFAILDTMFSSLTLMESVDPDISFDPLQIFWSVNNRRINDDEEFSIPDGDLRSSAFTFVSGIPTIFILGDTATDTDEYDAHVIAHEFGHFFQETISRDDSIGGAHSLSSRLDPRVSFSEGFGNALSAIVLEDPLYIDAGFGATGGFAFNIELNTIGQIIFNSSGVPAAGWYGESSVQSILFDIFDNSSDGVDGISAGFQPLYDAFLNPTFTDSDASTTFFSYMTSLLEDPAITPGNLTPLLTFQDINGTGIFGAGETNDGNVPTSLPVFPAYTIGEPPITVCSLNDAGTQNNIGVRSLVSLTVPSPGTFTLTMQRISGATNRDPNFFIFNEGVFLGSGTSDATDIETRSIFLPAGQLIVDALDDNNLDNDDDDVPADACYSFSAQ